jgi:hypothetical protein
LAEALKVNSSVANIDLRFNRIGDEGAKACSAPWLQRNPTSHLEIRRDANRTYAFVFCWKVLCPHPHVPLPAPFLRIKKKVLYTCCTYSLYLFELFPSLELKTLSNCKTRLKHIESTKPTPTPNKS